MPDQPYADAAPAYWRAGWRGVLPLPPRAKKHPPRGHTGAGAPDPSWPDITAWCEDQPDGNLALRLPAGVIGIDIDAYPGKRGAQTIAECITAWGEFPNTWRSTARDDGLSGIILFRVPDGLRWPGELPGGDVEIIQQRHRYAVAWPSVHPDLGTAYRWYTPDDDGTVSITVPRVDDLPWLPHAWVDGLTGGRAESDAVKADLAGGAAAASWFANVPKGAPCRRLTTVVDQARAELNAPGSRHDTMTRAVGRAVRAADGGHPGAGAALEDIRAAFASATGRAGSGQRDNDTATDEFRRALTGAIALVLGDPSDQDRPTADPCDVPFGAGLLPGLPGPAAASTAPSSSTATAAAAAPTPAPTPPAPAPTPAPTPTPTPAPTPAPAERTDPVDDDRPADRADLDALIAPPRPAPDSTGPADQPAPYTAPDPPTTMPPAVTAGGRERTSWWRRDLAPVIAGHDPEPAPSVLRRTDGAGLLYPGKVNGLLGASESGKTWVALAAVAAELIDGNPVAYFDFEDTAPGIVERLRALHVPDPVILDLFDYIGPDESLGSVAAAEDWRELIGDRDRTLIVVDGLNAALTQLGLDLTDNTDVTRFSTTVLRPMAATGAAVVTIDHIPKDKEKKSDGGIGAQAKRAMMTGCAIRCDVIKAFGRGQSGKLRLTVDKDRPGKVRASAPDARSIGTANLEPLDDNQLSVTITPAAVKVETSADGGFRPTGLMTAVSQFLAATPDEPYSGGAVERGVRGRGEHIRRALEVLVGEGYVRRWQEGQAVKHRHVRPYSELTELIGGAGEEGDDDA